MKVLIGRGKGSRETKHHTGYGGKAGMGREAESPLGTSFSNAAIPAAWASCSPSGVLVTCMDTIYLGLWGTVKLLVPLLRAL